MISSWLHSWLAAEPRTEITSWVAKSATSSRVLWPLPSTALPLVLSAERSPNHKIQIFGMRSRVWEHSGLSLTAQEYSKFFL